MTRSSRGLNAGTNAGLVQKPQSLRIADDLETATPSTSTTASPNVSSRSSTTTSTPRTSASPSSSLRSNPAPRRPELPSNPRHRGPPQPKRDRRRLRPHRCREHARALPRHPVRRKPCGRARQRLGCPNRHRLGGNHLARRGVRRHGDARRRRRQPRDRRDGIVYEGLTW